MSSKPTSWNPGGPDGVIPSTVQRVAVGATSARTAADWSDQTTFVEVCSSVACHIKFGTSSVEATTSDLYLPANFPRIYGVSVSTPRLAVIRASGDGFLTVTEGK